MTDLSAAYVAALVNGNEGLTPAGTCFEDPSKSTVIELSDMMTFAFITSVSGFSPKPSI